jgi:hypothetical protein
MMKEQLQDNLSIEDCKEHYIELHNKCNDILHTSFAAANRTSLCSSHNFISDLEIWIDILAPRPEVILLKAGRREYQFALLALVQGQYRHAFMALRLFLELSLSNIQFSANELELRIWIDGQRDINWNSLINLESGIFSKKFVGAFFNDLKDEAREYCIIAEKVYRECSEYTHGNIETHKNIIAPLKFDEDLFIDWHEKVKNIRLVLTFVLCMRYLRFFEKEAIDKIEQIVTEELGHLPAVQEFFAMNGDRHE